MTLETFFEKFDRFADVPDAVAKLREMVRHLAVTGKLAAQDPYDEPAEALVARIAAALPDKKSENPFLGKIETFITDESEYELPRGWAWLALGHTGIWATGCGFPMQYQGETDGEFLCCKVSTMVQWGQVHTIYMRDRSVLRPIDHPHHLRQPLPPRGTATQYVNSMDLTPLLPCTMRKKTPPRK
jgi:hypothetical protein